ncbi:MAG: queuosine precursor transporter, partial [Boseongicola sp.]|nr:queuosine precursor transporter [Boseongicola sp.]
MSRILPGILCMAAIVVASNILVQFLFGQWLTWGAFTYPLAFLVTDVMNRLYGAAMARRVVVAGFVAGVICSIVGTQITGEFGPLVTWRIAAGSGLAFLTAQLLDVAVFDRLREGVWWRAPFVSTLIGSALDTAILFTVAVYARLEIVDPA